MLQAPMPPENNPGSLLIYAAKAGRTEIVHNLLSTPLPISSDEKAVALSFSAISGNLMLTQTILALAGHDISLGDKGFALENAAMSGHVQVVEELLLNSALAIPPKSLNRSLTSASVHGHIDIARILLHHAGHLISPESKQKAIQNAAFMGRGDHAALLMTLLHPPAPVLSPTFTTKRKETSDFGMQAALTPSAEEETFEFGRAKMQRF
jgi:ankyrin repeat protein